jgi:selenocysteine lyase/cysteine desulfurase
VNTTFPSWGAKRGYLNTASFGIPPVAAVDATHRILQRWADGDLDFQEWFKETRLVRGAIARLLSVSEARIALGTSTSGLVSSIAASLPDGARVLAPVDEHNSNLIPYLNQARRGVKTDLVPLSQLAASVQDSTTLVVCSAVQSLGGEVAEISALRAATRIKGAMLCLDVSQACGWLPLSGDAADILVGSMYKWLCAPIGGAFLVMSSECIERFSPATPSWVAGLDPLAAPYGTAFQPAAEARKFDTVPNLLSLPSARYSIEAILETGVQNIHAHNIGLANQLRAGLGLPNSNSAIVTVRRPGASQKLAQAGIRGSEWRGMLRLSFHLYNSDRDVEHALDILGEAPVKE